MAISKYEKYVEPKLSLIADYIKQGLTDEQIAVKLGIAYSTLRVYLKQYPALSAVFLKEKRTRDVDVEDSLYKRALGHFVPLIKHVKVKRKEYDPTTNKVVKEYEELVEYEEQEYIPPDTGAAIFVLINNMPDRYSNNPHKHELDRKKFILAKKKAEQEMF